MKKADKIAGIIFLIIFISVFLLIISGRRADHAGNYSTPGIGLLHLQGVILNSEGFCDRLADFRRSKKVLGIVIRVDSPGGVVAPSQEIYQAIRKTCQQKPVIVSMGAVAASGAYYASLGADSIFANAGSLTGSIGVIMDYPVLTELLEKLGVDVATYKTGRYKDTGSPYRFPTPADSVYLMETMNDIYTQFLEDINREREIPKNQLLKIADGRIFTGLQAKELGLIDRIGTLEDAIDCAARMAGISGIPHIIRPPQEKYSLLRLILNGDLSGVIHQLARQPVPEYRWQ